MEKKNFLLIIFGIFVFIYILGFVSAVPWCQNPCKGNALFGSAEESRCKDSKTMQECKHLFPFCIDDPYQWKDVSCKDNERCYNGKCGPDRSDRPDRPDRYSFSYKSCFSEGYSHPDSNSDIQFSPEDALSGITINPDCTISGTIDKPGSYIIPIEVQICNKADGCSESCTVLEDVIKINVKESKDNPPDSNDTGSGGGGSGGGGGGSSVGGTKGNQRTCISFIDGVKLIGFGSDPIPFCNYDSNTGEHICYNTCASAPVQNEVFVLRCSGSNFVISTQPCDEGYTCKPIDGGGAECVKSDCVPNCEGKVCGFDGCGGTCDPGCDSKLGEICNQKGLCDVVPNSCVDNDGDGHKGFNQNNCVFGDDCDDSDVNRFRFNFQKTACECSSWQNDCGNSCFTPECNPVSSCIDNRFLCSPRLISGGEVLSCGGKKVDCSLTNSGIGNLVCGQNDFGFANCVCPNKRSFCKSIDQTTPGVCCQVGEMCDTRDAQNGVCKKKFKVSVIGAGSGSGQVSIMFVGPSRGGSGTYGNLPLNEEGFENDRVNVAPREVSGSVFVGFSGDCTGETCDIILDSDKTITAKFNSDTTVCTPKTLSYLDTEGVVGETYSATIGLVDEAVMTSPPIQTEKKCLINIFGLHLFCKEVRSSVAFSPETNTVSSCEVDATTPLPEGLSVSKKSDGSGCQISGQLTSPFSGLVKVWLTDTNGCKTSGNVPVNINCPSSNPDCSKDCQIQSTTSNNLPDGVVEKTYTKSIFEYFNSANNYNNYILFESNAPPGIYISPEGIVVGNPTVKGNFNFKIKAINPKGCSEIQEFIINIKDSPVEYSCDDVVVELSEEPKEKTCISPKITKLSEYIPQEWLKGGESKESSIPSPFLNCDYPEITDAKFVAKLQSYVELPEGGDIFSVCSKEKIESKALELAERILPDKAYSAMSTTLNLYKCSGVTIKSIGTNKIELNRDIPLAGWTPDWMSRNFKVHVSVGSKDFDKGEFHIFFKVNFLLWEK